MAESRKSFGEKVRGIALYLLDPQGDIQTLNANNAQPLTNTEAVAMRPGLETPMARYFP